MPVALLSWLWVSVLYYGLSEEPQARKLQVAKPFNMPLPLGGLSA